MFVFKIEDILINDNYFSLIKTISKHIGHDHEFLAFIFRAILDKEISNEVAIICANQNPSVFAEYILPMYIKEKIKIKLELKDQNEFVDTIMEMLKASLVKSKKEYNIVLKQIENIINEYTNHPKGKMLKDLFIRGMVLSKIKSEEVMNIEQKFWDKYEAKDVDDKKFYYENIQIIIRHKDNIRKEYGSCPPTQLHSFAINQMPYAEATYFYIFKYLVKIHTELQMELVPIEWDNVGYALANRKIQMAIHNPSIIIQLHLKYVNI